MRREASDPPSREDEMPTASPELTWIAEGVLAVGACPTSARDWESVASKGFQSAVVLCDGPSGGSHIRTIIELRNYDPRLSDRLIDAFLAGTPTYLCSDHGIESALAAGRRFARTWDLKDVERVFWDVRSLNAGDEFDWVNGHADFGGDRGIGELRIVVGALASQRAETRLSAADTLAEVMDHADHDCFGPVKLGLLEAIQPAVQVIVENLNPGKLDAYRAIFRKLAAETNGRVILRPRSE